MNKKYELLKIKYENTKTWLFSLIALVFSMSIGYYIIEDESFKSRLGITTWIVLIGIGVLYIMQIVRYKKLLNYLKK